MSIIGTPTNPQFTSLAAGTITTIVRDLIPDPVYDASGNALPDSDGGLFRAQSLYRFLNDGVKAVTQKCGWMIHDWTAVAVQAHVPHYPLGLQWHSIDEVFVNGWRLGRAGEGNLLWPQTIETNQGVVYSLHSVTDHWAVRLYPAPQTADPTTVLVGAIGSGDASCVVQSTTGLLPYGFIQIDSELIQYYNVNATTKTLAGLVRGVGGTLAVPHGDGASIQHFACWIKGVRVPSAVSASGDLVEVPPVFQYPLQLYVLARCRQAENEFGESQRLMKEFNDECTSRANDPKLKANQGMQVKAYGEAIFGPLAWGHVVVP